MHANIIYMLLGDALTCSLYVMPFGVTNDSLIDNDILVACMRR